MLYAPAFSQNVTTLGSHFVGKAQDLAGGASTLKSITNHVVVVVL